MSEMRAFLKSALVVFAVVAFLAPVAEADYWISSTGKTHHSACRYYQKGKGRLSKTPTKVDCKICKGAHGAAAVSDEGIRDAQQFLEENRRKRDGQPQAASSPEVVDAPSSMAR